MKFAWLLFAAPSFGQYLPGVQFSGLATTRDGAVLYFSSPLSLRGDDEFPNQKIFRIDPAGIHLLEQFPIEGFIRNYAGNFYNAIEPDVSADGSVFSFVAQRTCNGGSSCVFVELYQSHIAGSGPEIVYAGRTRLSHNGRYALRYGSTGPRIPSDPSPALIDLSTGVKTPVPGLIPEGRAVASDGTVLTLSDYSSMAAAALWKAGNSRSLLALPDRLVRGVVSDNAAVVALEFGDGTVELYEVASFRESALHGNDASISDDGRFVCYLNAGQALIYDRTSASSRQLNDVPEGVREAVVSGDGRTVWEATDWGRILRVEAATGNAQDVIPRTPLITSIQGAPVPGSLNWISGAGLSDRHISTDPPLPQFLAQQAVLLDSTPARIAQLTPDFILFQIPFEVPPGSVSVSLAANDSPFDSPPHTIELAPYWPQPVAFPPNFQAVIANHDFSRFINDTNPAAPGETVHVYFTGLGPVAPPLASGAAAEAGQLFPAVRGLSCVYSPSPGVPSPSIPVPAEILFAGMAPNYAGIYQVDFRLPVALSGYRGDPNDIDVFFECGNSYVIVPMNFSE